MKKIIFAVVILALIAFFWKYAGDFLTFEQIKENQGKFQKLYEDSTALVLLAYFFGYILVTGLSLPGAAVLTLAAGALFGLVAGTILVSFASSLGATAAFLVARYLVGETLQKKYGDKLAKINEGVRKEGAFYLFALRLIPAFPFFLINILMALTPMRTVTFYLVSQAGMLAGTIVYVNAGTQIAKIDSISGLFSPVLIGSFVVLGIMPIIAKKVIGMIRSKRATKA